MVAMARTKQDRIAAAQRGLVTRQRNINVKMLAEMCRVFAEAQRAGPRPSPPVEPLPPELRAKVAVLLVRGLACGQQALTQDDARRYQAAGLTGDLMRDAVAKLDGPPPLRLLAWVAEHFD